MTCKSVAVAVTTAVIGLFVFTQLIATFRLPELDFWRWSKWTGGDLTIVEETVEINYPLETETKETENLGERQSTGDQYLLGVGKADITGPVAEVEFMGYANLSQIGSGLRQRIYSRAFIIGDSQNPNDRFIYMILDTQSGDTAIRHGILQGLQNLGSDYAMYGESNVAVVGTHQHSGPAAWLNYLLPQITSKGFDPQSYSAIVDGALLSIQRAHESLEAGTLSVGTTDIEDANISRSLWAYLQNPASQRAQYSDNVDKTMTLLKFTRSSDGKDIGVLSWFAVHGTSMLGNNSIVTGDNKGVAAYLFERAMNETNPGFVAGFSQANVGDTSPNVEGAYCESGAQAGQQCDFETSLCDGTSEACHGRGPYWGLNDYGTKSCFEIGTRQFNGAQGIYNNTDDMTPIAGAAVKSLHSYVDFSNYTFQLPNGSIAHTCPAALGYSFAAGTTDGPGAFDFKQNNSGTPDASPVWAVVGGLLKEPSPEQKACQAPKPILLDVGQQDVPYAWAPNIVDIQMFRVGQLIIIISPGEATTMSGRRWRGAIANASASALPDLSSGNSSQTPIVVLGAPANSYTHYIATEYEYQVQRYEGASTLYGANTLNAYINVSTDFLPYLAADSTSSPPAGPQPPINTNNSLDFITGVVFDAPPILKSFGDVQSDVAASYALGSVANATFVGANPRNNLRLEGTFAAVEMEAGDAGSGDWTTVRDDQDWELVYEWTRTNEILGTSQVTISWEIPSEGVAPGTYRLRYYGDAKSVGGTITPFTGVSAAFTVG
ncbi:neutral ceramidase precursor [Viridothelium virens]|uniref:Neutral ceramidase n=1 Tax=Viridothelium virens TaxID=1048519 RepID=A0A6A6H9X8_VIRVR|nr:neutral ceramidase precursor [Viridothelium virens]